MALIEDTFFGTRNKVEDAIGRLKAFEPPDGYFLAFSGGKDSQCIYHLAEMAGVKFEAHYSVTSVDPPELLRFIKRNYPDVIWDRHYWNDGKPEHYNKDGSPKVITMWNLIADHTIPPTRQARYCCSELKETGGKGRVVVTGVRWAESVRRKEQHGLAEIRTSAKKLHEEANSGDSVVKKTKRNDSIIFLDDNSTARNMVEQCYAKKKTTVNPIIDWTEEDVWEFLNDVAKVPHCELYDEGLTRLGCIGCPLQGRDGMIRAFERYPRYKEKYIKAFDKMIANHPGEIKVATGQLAEPNGGGYSSSSGLIGVNENSQFLNVEREREREREPGEARARKSTDGSKCTVESKHTTNGSTYTGDGQRIDGLVDVDSEGEERKGRTEPAEIGGGGERHFYSNSIPGMEWWRQTAEWNFEFWVNNS